LNIALPNYLLASSDVVIVLPSIKEFIPVTKDELDLPFTVRTKYRHSLPGTHCAYLQRDG